MCTYIPVGRTGHQLVTQKLWQPSSDSRPIAHVGGSTVKQEAEPDDSTVSSTSWYLYYIFHADGLN